MSRIVQDSKGIRSDELSSGFGAACAHPKAQSQAWIASKAQEGYSQDDNSPIGRGSKNSGPTHNFPFKDPGWRLPFTSPTGTTRATGFAPRNDHFLPLGRLLNQPRKVCFCLMDSENAHKAALATNLSSLESL
jgi:hypothetical protein